MDCRKAPRGSQVLLNISRDRACEWIVRKAPRGSQALFISRDRACELIVEKAPRGSQALFISRDRACDWIVEGHLEDHRLYLSLGIEHVNGL